MLAIETLLKALVWEDKITWVSSSSRDHINEVVIATSRFSVKLDMSNL
jgi:hypothetical protein